MANELQTRAPADATVYAVVYDADGKPWNGSAFVNFVDADKPSYAVATVEEGTSSGYYVGNFPVLITSAALYGVEFFLRIGLSASVADTFVAGGTLAWTGTALDPGNTAGNLISSSYALNYLPTAAASQTTLVGAFVAAASAAVVSYTRNNFLVVTYSEYYDVSRSVDTLPLRQGNVTGLTSVTLYPYGSSPQVYAGADYEIINGNSIHVKPTAVGNGDCGSFPCGRQTVLVVYNAGTNVVPADVQAATALIVARLWYQKGKDRTMDSESLGDYSYKFNLMAFRFIDNDIKDILDRYKGYYV